MDETPKSRRGGGGGASGLPKKIEMPCDCGQIVHRHPRNLSDHQNCSLLISSRRSITPLLLLAVVACAVLSACTLASCEQSTEHQPTNQTTTTTTPLNHMAPMADWQANKTSKSLISKRALSSSAASATLAPPINLVVFRDEPTLSSRLSKGGPGSSKHKATSSSTNSSSSSSSLSSAHQLKRHSYKLTAGNSSELAPVRNQTATTKLKSGPDGGGGRRNGTAGGDPLATSDSYYSPQHRANGRYESAAADDPYDSEYSDRPTSSSGGGGGDDEESDAEDSSSSSSYIDGASSNLSEKKVVKELTKILSKGMSGATDQVRVETLESLKRRQRERKALKDNRARLFEEILTTAIQSHPDNVRGSTGKKSSASSSSGGGGGKQSKSSARVRGSASNLKNYPSPLPPSPSSSGSGADLDPELASDAETVLQHLHGLAAAIDGGGQGPASSAQDLLSPTPMSELSEAGGGGASEDSTEAPSAGESTSSGGGDSSATSEDERPKKASASPSERPLVRSFKKIKSQLSQRRKQLDQIKKLFNIELALDPKNGSLIGKPVASQAVATSGSSSAAKKKQQQQQQQQAHAQLMQQLYGPESGGSSDSESPFSTSGDESYEAGPTPLVSSRRARGSTSTSSGSSSSGATKGRELLAYLRENPEILASVMSELTVDADPSRGTGSSSRDETESPGPFHHSLASGSSSSDYDEAPSASSRRAKAARHHRRAQNHHNHHQHHQSQLVDPDEIVWTKAPRSRARRFKSNEGAELAFGGASATRHHRAAHRGAAASISPRSSFGGLASASSSFGAPSQQQQQQQQQQQPVKRRTAESLLLESLRERQLLNLARLDLVLAERNKTTSGGGASEQLPPPPPPPPHDHMESYRRSSYDPELGRQQQRQVGGNGTTQEELTHHFMVVNPSHYTGNDTLGRQLNTHDYPLGSPFNSGSQNQQPRLPPPPPYLPYAPPALPAPPMFAGGNFSSPPYGGYGSSPAGPPPPPPPATSSSSPHRPSQQQPQANQPQLGRFRNWRDVSQSELDRGAAPQQQQQPPPQQHQQQPPLHTNVSWYPYDLSTGGGSPLLSTMEAQSSKSTQFASNSPPAANYRAQPAPHFASQSLGLANSSSISSTSSLQAAVNQPADAGGPQLANANSLFMTRSSAAEPDVSTVKLGGGGGAQEDPNAREKPQQQAGRNQDLNQAAPERNDTAESEEAAPPRADEQPPAEPVEELAPESNASGGASLSPADYFSSYKDEIATARRRRTRASGGRRWARGNKANSKQQQQQQELQADMESDDTGAMWA